MHLYSSPWKRPSNSFIRQRIMSGKTVLGRAVLEELTPRITFSREPGVCSMRSKWCSRGQESWVIREVTENYESDSLGQRLKYYYRSGCKFGSEDTALTLLGYGVSHLRHLLTGNILLWKNMNFLEHGFPTLWMTYRTKSLNKMLHSQLQKIRHLENLDLIKTWTTSMRKGNKWSMAGS